MGYRKYDWIFNGKKALIKYASNQILDLLTERNHENEFKNFFYS